MPQPGERSRWPLYLALALIGGTLLRLAFGWRFQGWLGAPDALAWDLTIQEAASGASRSIRFDQLVHWPHEGASPLLTLIAIGLEPLRGALPPLAIVALLLDTVSRGIQILIAWKVFGRTTAVWFALWTITTVPGLLPWGTTNFGLHALSSFWPFVVLYLAAKIPESGKAFSALLGFFVALSICWSYDSLVLIPAALIALTQKRLRSTLVFLVTLLVTLTPYVALRLLTDQGFHLEREFSSSNLTCSTNSTSCRKRTKRWSFR